jgi:Fic family protein
MRELYEARNHYAALRMIEEWAATRAAAAEITERYVLDVHARVLTEIDASSAGRFRSGRVLIAGTGYVPPGSQKFDLLIPLLLQLANRTGIDPVIGAAELHYNLVAVHPFNDGNGRTARLMMNYYLLGQGYPLANIEVARRGEYLAALDEANGGACERFAQFVAESVKRSREKLLGED